jgi:DNA polymerase-3 subunit delta'
LSSAFTSGAPPWLRAAQDALEAGIVAGRLPHAVLIQAGHGHGGDWLAHWLAARLLCRNASTAHPCGQCIDCTRVLAAEHPDCAELRPIEDSLEIRIEQVRTLVGELVLSSHAGGYKIGIIAPAERMNRSAANALLKTLEEPTPRTVLVLVTGSPARLPATIVSRCSRVRVQAPSPEAAREWLAAARGPRADWAQVLEVFGNRPFDALAADADAAAALARDTAAALAAAGRGELDAVAVAENWSKGDYRLRLACIETWLTNRLRSHALGTAPGEELRAAPHLPASDPALNMKPLFVLLDLVREARALAETPVSKSLVLERLLRRVPAERGSWEPKRQ